MPPKRSSPRRSPRARSPRSRSSFKRTVRADKKKYRSYIREAIKKYGLNNVTLSNVKNYVRSKLGTKKLGKLRVKYIKAAAQKIVAKKSGNRGKSRECGPRKSFAHPNALSKDEIIEMLLGKVEFAESTLRRKTMAELCKLLEKVETVKKGRKSIRRKSVKRVAVKKKSVKRSKSPKRTVVKRKNSKRSKSPKRKVVKAVKRKSTKSSKSPKRKVVKIVKVVKRQSSKRSKSPKRKVIKRTVVRRKPSKSPKRGSRR